jgi:hypothetical protein
MNDKNKKTAPIFIRKLPKFGWGHGLHRKNGRQGVFIKILPTPVINLMPDFSE